MELAKMTLLDRLKNPDACNELAPKDAIPLMVEILKGIK